MDNIEYKYRYTTSELAGKICYFVAELYHAIIDEKIAPAKMRGTPLDMGQYRKFFRSVRIPKLGKDELHVAPFDKKNNHIVLLYKSNVYKVDVTNNEGAIYSSKAIADVIEKTFQKEQYEGVRAGMFTTAERDQAAAVYEQLSVSKINADILETIADSLIVISIDEESESSEEAIKNLMLSGENKYFDKTIQVVITKSGELGYSIEHSAVDGTTIFTVISYVNEGLRRPDNETVYTREKPAIEKKEWHISQEIATSLATFQDNFAQIKKDFHIKSRTFEAFGSDEIKGMNFSPNAFFHMALQIAQFRTFGKFGSVYEPVLTRFFYEGRTECARATSREKLNLVSALTSGDQSNEKLYNLMQEASDAHSLRILACQKGLGVERHMYGLEQIYKLYGADLGMTETPEIFKDKGYLTMRHDFISTSGMAYDNVKYRIFGPVVEGGYGLAYILLDKSISINISCRSSEKESARRLTNHLVDALHELRSIAISV